MTPAVATHGAALPVSKPGLPRSCFWLVQPVTLNDDALFAVPPAVVTEIVPVDEQFGTVAVICVELLTVNEADWPLNFTLVAPVKLEPVMVTLVPTPPLAGEKPEMVGAGVPPLPMKSS